MNSVDAPKREKIIEIKLRRVNKKSPCQNQSGYQFNVIKKKAEKERTNEQKERIEKINK